MSQKNFLIKVELDIQKITCPGVWLCSNGKVSLQIYMLDSCVQTTSGKPIFPISCYEKFVFYKTFCKERRLNELQRSLNKEWFYAELVQWQNCEEGCVLATFQTTLDELLYPSSIRRSVAGMDIDLLMEPTKVFPGTIAPKLEVNTKTTIEETICGLKSEAESRVIVNPKLLTSTASPPRKVRPRKVCHSVAFSRVQKHVPFKERKRPPFQYRRAEDDLILRNNPNVLRSDEIFRKGISRQFSRTGNNNYICYCNSLRSRSMESIQSHPKPCKMEPYNKTHADSYCPICSKYDGLFPSTASKMRPCYCTDRPLKFCSYCRQNMKYHLPSSNGSPCESEVSDRYDRRVCFCVPTEQPSLAQRLHTRLTKTLESNSRLLRSCVDCDIT